MVVQYRDDWKNQKVHMRAGKTKGWSKKVMFTNPVAQPFAISLDSVQSRWFPENRKCQDNAKASFKFQLKNSQTGATIAYDYASSY